MPTGIISDALLTTHGFTPSPSYKVTSKSVAAAAQVSPQRQAINIPNRQRADGNSSSEARPRGSDPLPTRKSKPQQKLVNISGVRVKFFPTAESSLLEWNVTFIMMWGHSSVVKNTFPKCLSGCSHFFFYIIFLLQG